MVRTLYKVDASPPARAVMMTLDLLKVPDVTLLFNFEHLKVLNCTFAGTRWNKMVRTLYKVDASPPARAVMMTLDLLKVPDVTLRDVDLFNFEHLQEEYLKLNPQHSVPTLVDGDFVIWDSHAITAYLVTQYAADDSLYPKDPKKRALVDQRLHFDSGVLFPSLLASVQKIVWKGATSFDPEALEKVQKGYEFLESFLAGRSWLAGDSMTIADICAVATVSSNNEFAPIDHKKYPNLTRWLKEFSKLDFYIKKNQPGCKAFGDIIRSKVA